MNAESVVIAALEAAVYDDVPSTPAGDPAALPADPYDVDQTPPDDINVCPVCDGEGVLDDGDTDCDGCDAGSVPCPSC